MMAVAPEARDYGLGTRLKLFQRDFLLAQGVEVVEWTFDPLEARNAHLNFNHLGAEVGEYVEDMYADETGSDLWAGIGTDRLILVWRLASERVRQALVDRRLAAADPFRAVPVVNEGNRIPEVTPDLPRLRLEVPENVQELKSADPERAAAWRASTRWAFETYLAREYRVEAFYRDRASARCFYCLERDA
jgi:predicted GNAT superfamily acetyltransferase